MATYREEIDKFNKQLRTFRLIRNICIPILIVTFIAAVAFLTVDMAETGTYTYGTMYWLGQMFTVLAQFAFDGVIVGVVFTKVWQKRITNRQERIRNGFESEDDWNKGIHSDAYVYEEPKEKESPTKDFTNPNDPFH